MINKKIFSFEEIKEKDIDQFLNLIKKDINNYYFMKFIFL